MSVEIPKVALAFAGYSPPQGDVIDLRIHLGCSREVSSFDCRLQNFDKEYSPGGTHPINVGDQCHFDIGRGSNCPTVLTGRVEKIRCESTPSENYIHVSGRCWGEKIFRRVVTKTYENQKGEAIVKDLLDNFVGLSHVRDSTELVENTDTTYTLLEYDKTPVFDILKYIAETADKAGVIGYDFRVAPDGKFEFFAKNSKSSPVSLSELIEVSEYSKDIHRIRNKIMVYGAAEKPYPLDADGQPWSDSLTEQIFQTGSGLASDAAAGQPDVVVADASIYSAGELVLIVDENAQEYNEISSIAGNTLTMVNNLVHTYTVAANGIVVKNYLWHADGKWLPDVGNTYVDIEETTVHTGSRSVKAECTAYMYYMRVLFEWDSGKYVNTDEYPILCFNVRLDEHHDLGVMAELFDVNDKIATKSERIKNSNSWQAFKFAVGSRNQDQWNTPSGFDWTQIKKLRFFFDQLPNEHGSAWVDKVFFGGKRWSKTREDSSSQTAYGLRELVEVDEELHSDNACDLRAKALLDYLGSPAEHITIRSNIIDYGTTPLLPADKIHVTLPNENIDSDFRIISVEYRVSARNQTLEITLELGREPALLADYLYALRSTSMTVERLARTKAGIGGGVA